MKAKLTLFSLLLLTSITSHAMEDRPFHIPVQNVSKIETVPVQNMGQTLLVGPLAPALGSIKGQRVFSLHAGEHFQASELDLKYGLEPKEFKRWAEVFCQKGKGCTKISYFFNGEPSDQQNEYLSSFGFKKKDLTYKLSAQGVITLAHGANQGFQVPSDTYLTIPENIVHYTSSMLSNFQKLYTEFQPLAYAPEVFKALVEKSLENGGKIYLALDPYKVPIGVIAWSEIETPSGRKAADVNSIYVTPRFQKKGISKDLMRSLLSNVIHNGYEYVQFQTGFNNHGAQSFYQNLGVPASGVEYRYEPDRAFQVLKQIGNVSAHNGMSPGELIVKNLPNLLGGLFKKR